MTGKFIDTIRYKFSSCPTGRAANFKIVETDFGKIRLFDSGGNKPVILNAPDGPNIIEHHLPLIEKLSKDFRVICFEFPGIGFSYPNSTFDYTFDSGAQLIKSILDKFEIEKCILSLSCSNGFYGMKATELFPERINHLFLTQTPSINSMIQWAKNAIPKVLTYPVIGQLANSISQNKLASIWYKYALPKNTDISEYVTISKKAIHDGSCFCLASLVQGLKKDQHTPILSNEVPSTMIWGESDFTHQKTKPNSLLTHLPNCELITFGQCGHFPELEKTHEYVKLITEKSTY